MKYLAKCPICYKTTLNAYPGIIETDKGISCTAGELGNDCVSLVLFRKMFGESSSAGQAPVRAQS